MSLGKQLVFNTADTTDSDNVGAYVRAGSNGDLIGDQTIASSKWLQVAAALLDGSGNALSSTGGSLNVNMTNTPTFDVGTADGSAFTVGTSIEQPVGGLYASSYTALTTGKTGAFAMTAYRALATSLQDQAGNYVGITGGALNVNISSSSVATADAALANTAIATAQANATTTAGLVPATNLANRKYLFIQNGGSKPIYIGATSGVTTTTGFPIPPGGTLDARIGAAVSVYMVAASGTQNVSTLELS